MEEGNGPISSTLHTSNILTSRMFFQIHLVSFRNIPSALELVTLNYKNMHILEETRPLKASLEDL